MMQYNGYVGKVEFDDEASVFHGEVINTRDVITFQGQTVAELKKAFKESVDDYLAFCESRGEAPDHPFSGQFVTRIPPELHRQVNLAANLSGKSLNAWVSEQLESAIARVGIDVSSAQSEHSRHRESVGVTQKRSTIRIGNDEILAELEKLRKEARRSWMNLRRELEGRPHGTTKVDASVKAFAKKARERTGLTSEELLEWLDKNRKG